MAARRGRMPRQPLTRACSSMPLAILRPRRQPQHARRSPPASSAAPTRHNPAGEQACGRYLRYLLLLYRHAVRDSLQTFALATASPSAASDGNAIAGPRPHSPPLQQQSSAEALAHDAFLQRSPTRQRRTYGSGGASRPGGGPTAKLTERALSFRSSASSPPPSTASLGDMPSTDTVDVFESDTVWLLRSF